MRRGVLAGLGVLAIGAIAFGLDTARALGVFRELRPHFAGSCRVVRGALGAEDLTIDPRNGRVYVSAYDRVAAARDASVGGALYAYDPAAASPQLVPLTPTDDPRLRPHGIHLWVGEDGQAALFVVNHPAPDSDPEHGDAHTIEIFDVTPQGQLVPRATLRDPQLLITPNDIAAVGPDRFYVTNTHANPPGTTGWQLETWLRQTRARVVYYDGSQFRPVLDERRFPNGINVSRDGRTLYVAETTRGQLLLYDRDPDSETLEFRSAVPLDSGADNIEIGDDGDVWIGAHPKLLENLRAMSDPAVRPPAQVLRVRADSEVEEVYLNAGDEASGVSVAAVRGDRMFLGQILADGILDCTLGGGTAASVRRARPE
jgi:arylesterase / paraoxonase